MQSNSISEIFANFDRSTSHLFPFLVGDVSLQIHAIITQVGELRGKEVIYATDITPIDESMRIISSILRTEKSDLEDPAQKLLATINSTLEQLKLHQVATERFTSSASCSSSDSIPTSVIPITPIQPSSVAAIPETKVIFPLAIINGGGYCFVSSPIQGLMRSPGFLAYLDWKEMDLQKSDHLDKIDGLLRLIFTIKREWQSDKRPQISDHIMVLRDLFFARHPELNIHRGGGDAQDFLSYFLKDIGFTLPSAHPGEESEPRAVSTVLFSHLSSPEQNLQDVITDDFQNEFAVCPTPPKTIIFGIPFSELLDTTNGLQFPEDGCVALFDRESNIHQYRINSFTYYPFEHYTQCLCINGQWYECDKNSIFQLTESELNIRKAKACMIFLDKVSEGVVEEIAIPFDAKIIQRSPPRLTRAGPSPILRILPGATPTRGRTNYNTVSSSSSSSSSSQRPALPSPDYEGERRDGRPHGKGRMTTLEGEIREGNFVHGAFKSGTLTYPSDSEILKEEGKFQYNLLTGENEKRIYRNGTVEEGLFIRGKFMGKE